MLLLLIRHGLTSHTNVKLTGWLPGVGLNDEGRAQAEGLVSRLDGLPIDALYSSPLERTRETAVPLARARRMRVTTRTALGEVRYGDFQGKTLKSLQGSDVWKRLRNWPSDVRFPGGESLRETQVRAVDAIETLRTEHPDDTVAVFSHGDFIRLAMCHYMGVHIDLYRRLSVDPVSVSALAFGDSWVQVRRVNDAGSLTDLAPKKAAPKATPKKKAIPREPTGRKR